MASEPVAVDLVAVRTALRTLHSVAPEAASVVERAVDAQEARIAALSSADPFRALVLSLADTMAASNEGVRFLRAAGIEPLVRAEVDRRRAAVLMEERLLADTQITLARESARSSVLSKLADPKVAGAVIGVVLLIVTIIGKLLLKGDL